MLILLFITALNTCVLHDPDMFNKASHSVQDKAVKEEQAKCQKTRLLPTQHLCQRQVTKGAQAPLQDQNPSEAGRSRMAAWCCNH